MRSVPHRRHSGLLGSIPYFIRVGIAPAGCPPPQKLCHFPYFSFDHDERLSAKFSRASPQYHRQIISLLSSKFVPVQCESALHTSSTGFYVYSEIYAHSTSLKFGKCLCTMAPKEAEGCSERSKAEWEMLSDLMRDLKDGLAKGKALEALKSVVDQLALSAELTDPRLGLAFLRLARSLEAAGEEPYMYLGYAKRALKCFETLDGSWDHIVCLFTLGSFYVGLGNIDNAVSMFEKCASVTQQTKGSTHDGHRNDSLMFLHHVLGQLESYRENHHKSLGHFENAIRFGKKTLKLGSPKLAVMYFKAAMVCRRASDLKASMWFAQKALEGFMTCYGPSSLQVGKVRALMSGIHCDLKKYKDALSEYTEAKPILEYLNYTEEVANMNLDMANLLIYQNKTEAALLFLQEVIKITEGTSLFHLLALIRAGSVSSELKLDTCSGDYCQKAVDALDHHEVSCDNAYDLIQLGLLLENRGEFECAEVLFKKTLNWVDRFSYWPYTIHVKGKIMQLESRDKSKMQQFCKKVGTMLFNAQKYKHAIPYLQRSLNDAKSGNGIQLFHMHLNLGASHGYLNQKAESLSHLTSCKEILSEWFWLRSIYLYYDFLTKNRRVDSLIVLENLSICALRFLV